ncbi:hypothetical protein ACV30Q_04645 [Clostridium perfringens]|uniref:Uncharacterized protein n=1 Tax=Clostridium perfringens TaxID=1502 RepID=A0AAN5SEM1_CLOPF|nr:hypothetical protein [Clostridium perfringens]AQW25656.1 hypothetical protein BXT94_02175 [Clostridium perfringens]ASY50461.1 hypothetical protein BG908_01890 [Clostridium perfringens]AWS24956.1 hypothetical protein CYK96_04880 [Clostridium perfringens]KAB8120021.1 hypothetical protein FVB38_08535 [Clostridium perfringens]KQC93956.1 hypothetical protein AM596_01965 [Clostridium perfringens CP4]
MFEYTLTDGELNINTPFCKDFSQVENEVISSTPDSVHIKSKYPNGFTIEYLAYSNKIIFKTNKPLIKNPDGSFDVQL